MKKKVGKEKKQKKSWKSEIIGNQRMQEVGKGKK